MATGKITAGISSVAVSLSKKNQPAHLYKQGNMVWLSSLEDFTSLPSGTTVLGTIPEGYRPANGIRIPISNRASDYSTYYYVDITYAGVISVVWGGSAKTSAFNGTFQTSYFSSH